MQVNIVDFPETKVAVYEHRGSPSREHESVKKFIAWKKSENLLIGDHKNYGVHYDDPNVTPDEDYRVDFCLAVKDEVPENHHQIVNKIIPDCRCAYVRHFGSLSSMNVASFLYNTWLPQSSEQLGEFPIFFHYVKTGPHVKDEDIVIDVYLPLQ